MKKQSKKRLVNLSSETKSLINQGIYSLYSLTPGASPGASYVLYTSKRSFLLNDTGVIVKEEAPNFRISVDQAVNYIDADGTAVSVAKKFA